MTRIAYCTGTNVLTFTVRVGHDHSDISPDLFFVIVFQRTPQGRTLFVPPLTATVTILDI